MNKHIKMFLKKMMMVSDIRLDESEIVADGEFHLVNDQHFYVLSTDNPPVGYFGNIGNMKPQKWALLRRCADDERAYKKKCRKLKKVIKEELNALRLKDVETPIVDDDAIVTQLASLALVGYDRVRKNTASAMGIRVGTLDELIKAKRKTLKRTSPSDVSSPTENRTRCQQLELPMDSISVVTSAVPKAAERTSS